VAPEEANLRAAARWTIDAGEGELAIGLTAVLWRFWHALGLVNEGRALAERALAMAAAPAKGATRASAEAAAGSLAYWQGEPTVARAHYERELTLAEEAADEAIVADAWFNLSHVLFLDGRPEQAQREFVDRVVARYRDLGDEWGLARAEWATAVIAMSQGKVGEAYGRLVADRDRFERLDDRQYLAMTNASIGWAAFMQGDMPSAIRYCVAALVETHAMRDLGTTAISLHVGVLMASMLGAFQDAARLSGAFDALCQRYGVRPPASLETFIGDIDPLGSAREQLGAEAFAAALERGRQMSLDEAVALIVELGLSRVDGRGRHDPRVQTRRPGYVPRGDQG
jgi:tetratricopeptide (TPR) repeat protein